MGAQVKKAIIIITFILATASFGQGFTFHGTLAFPQGDFKAEEIESEDAGFAGVGYGGGIEILSPPMAKKIFWIGSVYYNHHGVRDDLALKYQAIDEVSDGIMGVVTDDELDSFNCISFTTGIRFQNMFDRRKRMFGLFIDGQAGFSMVYAPDYEFKVDHLGTQEHSLIWDMGNSFTFSLGGGFIMWNKVILGVKYVNYLTPEFEGKYKIDSDTSVPVKFEQPISVLSINLGLTFQ